MKKRLALLIIMILATFSHIYVSEAAEQKVKKSESQIYIDSLLSQEPLRTAQFGILAVKISGDTIAESSSIKNFIPASNIKLITTGLALNELGSDFRFETLIGYSGTITDDVLKGDLYIIGGGDPTIGSKDSIAKPVEQIFSEWHKMLSEAGIRSIDGSIIGDGRFFEGPIEETSWLYEDIGTYYGTGANALCFFKNIQSFNVIPGNTAGSPLKISPAYPDTPWMKFSYNCTTGKKETGDRLYLFETDLYPNAEIRGTFGSDRKYRTVKCSNKFGAYTCAYHFMKYLNTKGLDIKGGCADIDIEGRIRKKLGTAKQWNKATAQEQLTIIGKTLSPQLHRIAFITNQQSDNFYAEAIYRMLGKKMAGTAEYGKFDSAIDQAINRLEIKDKSGGYKIVDGSGLSKKDYASPDFLCKFLKAMMETSVFETYLSTLTQPDKGTQTGRLRNSPASIKERIYWKSGSMDGVRCYSGYIVPSEGTKEDTIIFSVMLNNCTAPNWKANLTMDSIIESLAKEN